MRHDISLNQEMQIISLFINNLGCFLVCLFFLRIQSFISFKRLRSEKRGNWIG